MPGRGFTVRVDRITAMRALAQVIRTKTADFEKEKKAYPKRFSADKRLAVAKLSELKRKLVKAKTVDDVRNWSEIDYKFKGNLFRLPPTLNVCSENRAIQMLQMDNRKTVSINSNSDVWAMLEGKCEVVRA